MAGGVNRSSAGPGRARVRLIRGPGSPPRNPWPWAPTRRPSAAPQKGPRPRWERGVSATKSADEARRVKAGSSPTTASTAAATVATERAKRRDPRLPASRNCRARDAGWGTRKCSGKWPSCGRGARRVRGRAPDANKGTVVRGVPTAVHGKKDAEPSRSPDSRWSFWGNGRGGSGARRRIQSLLPASRLEALMNARPGAWFDQFSWLTSVGRPKFRVVVGVIAKGGPFKEWSHTESKG